MYPKILLFVYFESKSTANEKFMKQNQIIGSQNKGSR